MTRAEAIDILRVINPPRETERVFDEFIQARDMAIKALEEQQWVPCSVKYPEENGTYLACYEDATVLLDWFNGKWFFYQTNPSVEETGTIIAWMPLPEPWKDGDAE